VLSATVLLLAQTNAIVLGSLVQRVSAILSVCNSHKSLVDTLEGRSCVGRLRHRWEDNTKIDVNELGWEGVVWAGISVGSYSPIYSEVIQVGAFLHISLQQYCVGVYVHTYVCIECQGRYLGPGGGK
jgi:hypothetical protein